MITFVPARAGWAVVARMDRQTGRPSPDAHLAVGQLLGWLIPNGHGDRLTVAHFPGGPQPSAPINLRPEQIELTSATWEGTFSSLPSCCGICHQLRSARSERTPA